MSDEIDDILGSAPPPAAARAAAPADDIDDILGAGGGAAIPGVTARLPPQQPRSMSASDAEIGDPALASGPLYTFPTGRADLIAAHNRARPSDRPADSLEADPLSQLVATTAVLGPLGRVVTGALAPTLGRAAIPLVAGAEGAAASKSMGGSALSGAALGAGFGALGALARGATPAAAAARVEGRLVKDINKGVTKATARNVNEVKFKAGEGNEDLAQVANELPEVGKALKTQAKTNPAAAHKVTDDALTDLVDKNDADFSAIQRQHGGVELKPIVDRMEALESRLNQQGHGVSADAVGRARADLLKRYGRDLPGAAETEAEATALRAAEERMASLRSKAAAARQTADEARGAMPEDKPLLEEARKIDAPQSREQSLLEAARAIDAPLSRDAAADVGRAEVAGVRAAERTSSESTRKAISDAEARAHKLERMASKAERDFNRLSVARKHPSDVRLTANQVRNMRNDLGTVVDPQRTIKPNTRRQALAKIYGILNKEIEDVAENTRGVDVNALRARNRQISTLIPVRDALAERAEKLGDRDIGIVGLMKEAPRKAGQRIAREIDYRLSQIPLGGELGGKPLPASVGVPAAQSKDRNFARRVSDGMSSGMSLLDAFNAAEAH